MISFNYYPIAGASTRYKADTCSSNEECEGRKVCDVKVKQIGGARFTDRFDPDEMEETEQAIGYCVRCVVDSDCQERARAIGGRSLRNRAAAGAGAYCFQNKCKDKLSDGATCIKPTWCASGECVSNTCGAMGGNGDQKFGVRRPPL